MRMHQATSSASKKDAEPRIIRITAPILRSRMAPSPSSDGSNKSSRSALSPDRDFARLQEQQI